MNFFSFLSKFIKLGKVYQGNTGGDLGWLTPSALDSIRRNGLTYHVVGKFAEEIFAIMFKTKHFTVLIL